MIYFWKSFYCFLHRNIFSIISFLRIIKIFWSFKVKRNDFWDVQGLWLFSKICYFPVTVIEVEWFICNILLSDKCWPVKAEMQGDCAETECISYLRISNYTEHQQAKSQNIKWMLNCAKNIFICLILGTDIAEISKPTYKSLNWVDKLSILYH